MGTALLAWYDRANPQCGAYAFLFNSLMVEEDALLPNAFRNVLHTPPGYSGRVHFDENFFYAAARKFLELAFDNFLV